MIICIIGAAGSGKTTIGRRLATHLQSGWVDVSAVVEKISGTRKHIDGRKKLQSLHKSIEQDNPNWLAIPLCQQVDAELKEYGLCVVVGFREPYLLYSLQTKVVPTLVFYLDVDPFRRYCRLCERDGFISVETFQENDKGDEKLGLSIIKQGKQHHLIDANHSVEEVVNSIEVVLFQNGIRSPRKLGEKQCK